MFTILKYTNKKVKHFFMTSPNIKKVAKIARISITEDEAKKYQSNLDSIIPWFHDMLSTEVPDFINPVYSLIVNAEGSNYFNDEIKREDAPEEVLFNVPSKKQNLIVVPKVI